MAYNATNEIKEVIATFDKNKRGDKIRVTKVSQKESNKVSIDVRTMYTADDLEIKPTTKGIRIDSEMAADVIVAMLKALGQDIIQDVMAALDSEWTSKEVQETSNKEVAGPTEEMKETLNYITKTLFWGSEVGGYYADLDKLNENNYDEVRVFIEKYEGLARRKRMANDNFENSLSDGYTSRGESSRKEYDRYIENCAFNSAEDGEHGSSIAGRADSYRSSLSYDDYKKGERL